MYNLHERCFIGIVYMTVNIDIVEIECEAFPLNPTHKVLAYSDTN